MYVTADEVRRVIVTFVGSVERTRTRLEDKGVNGISFHPRFGQSFSRDQTVPVISPTGNIDNAWTL